MQKSTKHLLSLDLCRGLAALCVMLYHVNFLFSNTGLILFARGYLCVDFFFILSGYVISKSYDEKIERGLSPMSFSLLRIARLWPLVVLTTLLGFVFQYLRFRRDIPDLSAVDLLVSLATNIFMLPSPRSPNDVLFPFNPAAWSIFFELVSNALYIVAFRYLVGRTLVATIIASGLALTATALTLNSVDVGMTYQNFMFGFPRVLFSFFLGVWLFRRREDLWRWPTTSAAPFLSGLFAVGVLLSIPQIPIDRVNGLLDLFAVAVVFPVLLRLAEGTTLPARANWLAWFVGGISYSVYLLQTPLMVGFSALPQLFLGQKVAAFVPWGGIVFSLALPPVAFVCWKYFERPAQRWLIKVAIKAEPLASPTAANRGGINP